MVQSLSGFLNLPFKAVVRSLVMIVPGLLFSWFKSNTLVPGLIGYLKMLVLTNLPYQLSAEAQNTGPPPCWSKSLTIVPGLIGCLCLLVLRNLPDEAVVNCLMKHESQSSRSVGHGSLYIPLLFQQVIQS